MSVTGPGETNTTNNVGKFSETFSKTLSETDTKITKKGAEIISWIKDIQAEKPNDLNTSKIKDSSDSMQTTADRTNRMSNLLIRKGTGGINFLNQFLGRLQEQQDAGYKLSDRDVQFLKNLENKLSESFNNPSLLSQFKRLFSDKKASLFTTSQLINAVLTKSAKQGTADSNEESKVLDELLKELDIEPDNFQQDLENLLRQLESKN